MVSEGEFFISKIAKFATCLIFFSTKRLIYDLLGARNSES